MTTRRGFLGGFLGAAAAGPAAAKSILGSGLPAKTEMFLPGPSNIGIPKGYTEDSRASIMGRIAELRSLTKEQKRERYGAYRGEADRVSVLALRSVSDINKARIIYEREVEREAERNLMWALRELAGLQ